MKLLSLVSICILAISSAFGQQLSEIQKITASNRIQSAEFGRSVDVSGSYAIVSSAYEDSVNGTNTVMLQAGAAYIFEQDSLGQWVETQKLVPKDRDTAALFGYDVAISGNLAIVGAINVSSPNAYQGGAAYIFKRNSMTGQWSQIQKLIGSGRDNYDDFGRSVAISGTYIVVGDPANDRLSPYVPNNPGAIHIFEESTPGTWTEVNKFYASDIAEGQFFGWAVDISGPNIVVGAYGETRDVLGASPLSIAGAAYVFNRNGTGVWSETDKLVNSDRAFVDKFGYSVAIHNDQLIVGAIGQKLDTSGLNSLYDAGAAYVFKKLAGSFTQTAKLISVHRHAYAEFGNSVDIRGDWAIAGVENEDSNATATVYKPSSGAAYLYKADALGNWMDYQKLTASDQDDADFFGSDVRLEQDLGFVGAYGENLASPFNAYSGAAYFFSGPIIYQDTLSICDRDSIYFGGSYINTSGSHYDTISFSNRPDSIIMLYLIVYPTKTTGDLRTICKGDSSLFQGQHYSTSGRYTDTLQGKFCDSILILDLIVQDIHDTIFRVGSTFYGDTTFSGNIEWFNCDTQTKISGATGPIFQPNSPGNYAVIYSTLHCTDTSDCLRYCGNITISYGNAYVICKGDSVLHNGIYYSGNTYKSDTLINQFGCDSIRFLRVDLWEVPDTIFQIGNTIYGDSTFFGTTFLYNCDTKTSLAGSGSTFSPSVPGNYALIFNDGPCWDTSACIYFCGPLNSSSGKSYVICKGDSILHNGIYYTGDFYKIDTLTNQYGCDSVGFLQVDLWEVPDTIFQKNNLIYGDSTFTGLTFLYNCDTKTRIPNTGKPTKFLPAIPGNYALIFNDGPCWDTSDCISYNSIDLQEHLIFAQLSLHPNPTSDQVTIDLPASFGNDIQFELINSVGQVFALLPGQIQPSGAGTYTLDLSTFANGQYMLKASSINGSMGTGRIIKIE